MDMVIDEMRKAFRKRPPILKCECNVCEESQNNTCITDGLCYTEIHGKNGEISYTYGCLNRQQFLPPEDIPFVCRDQKYGVQCCFHDYCNRDLLPALPTENEKYEVTLGGYETSLIAFSCVVVLMLVFIFFFCIRYQKEKLRRNCRSDIEANHENRIPLMDTRISELRNCTTSGSGSGAPSSSSPHYTPRKVTLVEMRGKGGPPFGGGVEGLPTTPFSALSSPSQTRTKNRGERGGKKRKDNGTWTQLWLVTDYHPNGSLFDYLSKTTVDVATMYTMALSIANGLAHLHLEILGTQGKPALTPDLKSKNILVKRDGTCAIAPWNGGALDSSPDVTSPQPEGGHVLWEIARRCNVDGIYEEYQLPYYDMVPSDPSVEEMRKVICDAKLRPPCPNRWQSQESLRVMSKIMKECWYQNAAARLTALRIKKTLAALGVQKDMKI
ncbi:Activin receptor type-1B like protein [Argiope bruennichi]|uniref:Activin receptor type-1B like protein n=1 Tax=Argiope bruennichi TaxID=94029 RepID=A0A8T0EN87_ARGBR|nr:Activin receptor type-1B like protein [Argiope bruennichi]